MSLRGATIFLSIVLFGIMFQEGIASGCTNRYSSCDAWRNYGFCTGRYATWMKQNCKKSCGVCGGCDSTSNFDIKLRVETEHFEDSIHKASRHSKVIYSSSASQKLFQSLSKSGSVSASYNLFSGSAAAAYEEVSYQAKQHSRYEEYEKGQEVEFKAGFLQIRRVITTTVTINGVATINKDTEYVDSVSINNNQSPAQLYERSRQYMLRKFGSNGNRYDAAVCVEKKRRCSSWSSVKNCPGGSGNCNLAGVYHPRQWKTTLNEAKNYCDERSDCRGITRDSNGYEPRRGPGIGSWVSAVQLWLCQV